MIFEPLPLGGAFRLRLEPNTDERGFFARSFCRGEFERAGLPTEFPQSNLSHNRRRHTLRGMHFQHAPHSEAKIVRCVRGAVFDVLVDLRPESPTLGRWAAEVLTPDNGLALYVPEGFAHGFQTLVDDSDLLYQMSAMFKPGLGQGVRWNDPALGIDWPSLDPVISDRDASYSDWKG